MIFGENVHMKSSGLIGESLVGPILDKIAYFLKSLYYFTMARKSVANSACLRQIKTLKREWVISTDMSAYGYLPGSKG